MRHIFASLLLLSLAACATGGGDPNKLELAATDFAAIPGWAQDRHARAFGPFAESCRVNAKRSAYYQSRTGVGYGDPEGWRKACAAATHLQNPTDEEARLFFETHFTPFRATTEASKKGLTTGYYEPLLHGSMTRTAEYNVPVYGVPHNYKRPTYSRAQIENGALKGKAPVLLYVNDKVMLFFLQIQGSGKVRLNDGRMVGLQYAAQNGHGYVPIGRVLKERGELEKVSMQTIRDWLKANPYKADEVMNQNPSYIFFKLASGEEYAKGALGIPLTPSRSVAVDDDRTPYGLPIYIATKINDPKKLFAQPFRKLTVAQDTGGAILGPIRYDIFFGRGERAEWKAGHQNTPGEIYWLLPKTDVPSEHSLDPMRWF